MQWIDFAVCLFFGVFGVHKFREHKVGMGILYLFTLGLFGIGWIYDCIRYFIAALHGTPATSSTSSFSLDANSPLPIVSCSLMMAQDECCHYSNNANLLKTTNRVTGYSGRSAGVSVRIMKGVSLRTGASKGTPIRENVTERIPGTLSITNKRVVFSGNQKSFDKKFTSLSGITPYSDGIGFQFGASQYTIQTNDANYILQIINRIINE